MSPPHPIACQLEELLDSLAAAFIVETGLPRYRLPSIISEIMIGNPIIKMHAR